MLASVASATAPSPAITGITVLPARSITPAATVPKALQQFLQKVECRALENERQALLDRLKFWSLKGIAVFAAGTAIVIVLRNHEPGVPVTILNGILTLCVVVDGIRRPGERRNLHLRASEDLRNLKADLENRWRMASFEGYTSSTTLAQILEDGWREWKRITGSLEGEPLTGSKPR